MLVRYIAGLKPQDGGFLVRFPQFPEIVTDGRDLVEAVKNARDALELVAEDMAADGDALPDPDGDVKLWSALIRDGYHPQVIEAIVPDEAPAARYNISMAPTLMERVDRKAEETGRSRSAFIADALRDALAE